MGIMGDKTSYSAAMIAIGDELLSGRTRDSNIIFAAQQLAAVGIDLEEVRIIADREQAIIAAINDLRFNYDYLMTCGGIGATHDDITAPSVAKALGLACIIDARAEEVMARYYAARNLPFTDARRLMARMPEGAQLIDNPVSGAPGFKIANIFVLAGVPPIFEAMLQGVISKLAHGVPMRSITLACPLPEGTISADLAEIQQQNPGVLIGSYPQFVSDTKIGFKLELVVRSRDEGALQKAAGDVQAMIERLQRQ